MKPREETIALFDSVDKLTPHYVAKALKLTPAVANRRLRSLWRIGAVERAGMEQIGRYEQFVYVRAEKPPVELYRSKREIALEYMEARRASGNPKSKVDFSIAKAWG
jgi:predicted transcriptional regulator